MADAVEDLLAALPGCYASTADADLAMGLLAAGAQPVRHARQMRRRLPVSAAEMPEALPFAADARPPVPWPEVMPAFLAAYPPDHVDHLPGGEDLIDSYLVPYTAGARLGPLIAHASGIAVRDGYAYAGILIVDRPGEGPWVCDIWRDPRPEYAGAGAALLLWAASRLAGRDSLGLVVTVGNTAAERAYEKAGFVTEITAWTVRLPGASPGRGVGDA